MIVVVSNQMGISSLSHKGKEAAAKDPYEFLFYAFASVTIDSKLWKIILCLIIKSVCDCATQENTQSQL